MKILATVVALVFFLGGILLLGIAFRAVGFESLVFISGILAISASLAIPVHVLKRLDP